MMWLASWIFLCREKSAMRGEGAQRIELIHPSTQTYPPLTHTHMLIYAYVLMFCSKPTSIMHSKRFITETWLSFLDMVIK